MNLVTIFFIYILSGIFAIVIKKYINIGDFFPDFFIIFFFIFCYLNNKKRYNSLFKNIACGLLAGFILDTMSLSVFGTFMICYSILGIIITIILEKIRFKNYITNSIIVFTSSLFLYFLYMFISYILYENFLLEKLHIVFTVSFINTFIFIILQILINNKSKKIISYGL